MPPYEFLIEQKLNTGSTKDKIRAMKTLGVSYDDYAVNHAETDLAEQAKGIAENLAKENIKVKSDREIIALIAYLQRLGTDIKKGQWLLDDVIRPRILRILRIYTDKFLNSYYYLVNELMIDNTVLMFKSINLYQLKRKIRVNP